MRTICIYHSRDLDGWMSAAIVKKWFIENHNHYDIHPDGDFMRSEIVNDKSGELTLLGWDYGDDIPNLEEYDKVIMCDISFPAREMHKISMNTHLIWLDHHKSAIEDIIDYNHEHNLRFDGIHGTVLGLATENIYQFSACELTWKYFFPNEEMPEIVRLLGRYDCFGHKGTDEEQKVLEFQYGARQVISNYEEAYEYLMRAYEISSYTNLPLIEGIYRTGAIIYRYLVTEAKQDYKKIWALNFGKYHFAVINKQRFNPVNFGINYHKEGYDGFACFHYELNKGWCFSLYNDNGEVDVSTIAKQYGGGGHKGAAGFIVKALDEIIK